MSTSNTYEKEFEKWLRVVCFQKPTPEAYDLAKSAWFAAIDIERNMNVESQSNEKEKF